MDSKDENEIIMHLQKQVEKLTRMGSQQTKSQKIDLKEEITKINDRECGRFFFHFKMENRLKHKKNI